MVISVCCSCQHLFVKIFGQMNDSRPYHHGNLREVLLEAALQLIAEVGPGGFTLREVARRAGVSHNAPYRHFADKDALLAAVAEQGFRELTEAMREAAGREESSSGQLRQSGLAYIGFALRRPQHFAVMFDLPAMKRRSAECEAAGRETFMTLVGYVESSSRERHLIEGNVMEQAYAAWSLVHGVAKLASSGQLPYGTAVEVLQFAETVLTSFLTPANS